MKSAFTGFKKSYVHMLNGLKVDLQRINETIVMMGDIIHRVDKPNRYDLLHCLNELKSGRAEIVERLKLIKLEIKRMDRLHDKHYGNYE